jgi:opacity protein-like surface antigen
MKEAKLRRKVMKARRERIMALFLVFGMFVVLPSVGKGNTENHQVEISQDWQAIAKDFHLVRDSAFTLSTGMAEEKTTNTKKNKVAMEVGAGMAVYSSKGYGAGFRYGLGIITELSKRVAFEILIERYSVSVNEEAEELGAGRLHATPLLFNVLFAFTADKPLVPYAILGVGFYFFHFEPADLEEGEEQQEDLVDRFSLLVGGGVEYHVSRKLAFLAEARYGFVKTWMQRIDEPHVDPDEQTKITPNSLVLSLGLRFYF